jgi:hypothetical protein
LKVLKQASAHKDNTPVLDAWARILGIEEANQARRASIAAELLIAMRRELSVASAGLAKANISQHVYEGALVKIEHAISPLLLPASWNQVKQYVTPDVLTALAFCTEILPDEEAQITDEQLEQIRGAVEALRATLAEPTLPDRLRELVAHHAELIERALNEYPLVGAKALREAARTALGEIIEARDDLTAAKGTEAVSKLEKTWRQVNSIADTALKGEKLTQLGQRAWDAISGMF